LGFPIHLQIASPATPQQGEGGRRCRQFQVVLFSGILAIARDSAFRVLYAHRMLPALRLRTFDSRSSFRHCASAGPASRRCPLMPITCAQYPLAIPLQPSTSALDDARDFSGCTREVVGAERRDRKE
jgi:hypothetical protein